MALIKPNDRNAFVRQLQVALKVPVTGVADAITVQAVRVFQTSKHLTADGIAGPATLAALGLNLVPSKITLADYERAAQALGVTVAHVRTVTEVEARGSGFLSDNRPIILFERHIFYRQLIVPRKPGESVTELVGLRAMIVQQRPDLCNPKAGGYGNSAQEWDRLTQARTYSDTAGLESASYGLFQIMGFNAARCGFGDVQSFFRAMSASEGDQLDAFVQFLLTDPTKRLQPALKAQDWKTFAANYNGPNYAINQYDTKLAAAFKKWSAT